MKMKPIHYCQVIFVTFQEELILYCLYVALHVQVKVVSELFSSNWEGLKDFIRAINPPFERGESFVDDIERERADRESNYDWATHCLQIWVGENPNKNFLHVVSDTLARGIENGVLLEELRNRFPQLRSS